MLINCDLSVYSSFRSIFFQSAIFFSIKLLFIIFKLVVGEFGLGQYATKCALPLLCFLVLRQHYL